MLAKLSLSDEVKLGGESYPDEWFTDERANLAKYRLQRIELVSVT